MKKTKIILISSLTLNVLLALYIALGFWAESQISDIGLYNATYNKLCGENYDKILADIDARYAGDQEAAHNAKNSFAINVCLRNYKTGQKLDVQPLIDQVK